MARGTDNIRGRGNKSTTLTPKQAAFAREYVLGGCKNGKEAAMRTGTAEKSAASLACQYMNSDLYPLVVAEISRLKAMVDEQTVMDAQQIRQYIHSAMRVNLLRYFLPAGDESGGWLISLADLRKLPDHVAQLVEAVEISETRTTTKDGVQHVETIMWCKVVSKTVAMTTAAKYGLVEKREVKHGGAVGIAEALGSVPRGDMPDEVERRMDLLLEYKDGNQDMQTAGGPRDEEDKEALQGIGIDAGSVGDEDGQQEGGEAGGVPVPEEQ